MRNKCSGLVPGASRSISPSIVSGRTFFSRKARVRKMITVTETIEQMRSGHMNTPPLAKNPTTVSNTFMSQSIREQAKCDFLVHAFGWQCGRHILGNWILTIYFQDRLETHVRENFVRAVADDLEILHSPPAV